MNQSLFPVLLFVVFLAMVPLGLKWARRHKLGGSGSTLEAKVLSAVAVGPQQRVVSVEVGPADARVLLTLGVTSQSIHVLHSTPVGRGVEAASVPVADAIQAKT